jgi:hypothetical protein
MVLSEVAGVDTCPRGDGREWRLMVLPLVVAVAQHEFLRLDWSHDSDGHELPGVAIGQAAKEYAINDAENSSGGSAADGEGKNGGDGERRKTRRA